MVLRSESRLSGILDILSTSSIQNIFSPFKTVFHKERSFLKSIMRIENRFANIFVPKWKDLKTFSWNFNFNFAVTTSPLLSSPLSEQHSPLCKITFLSFSITYWYNSNHGCGLVVLNPSPYLSLIFQGDSFNKILLQRLKYQSCQSRKEKPEFFLFSCLIFLESFSFFY